jgi:hypothetical protein
MNLPESVYPTQPQIDRGIEKFLFVSEGVRSVVKAIEYRHIFEMNGFPDGHPLNGRQVFNLGFGDYDILNDHNEDSVLTENGDARKVFNTVLHSIPKFFEDHKNIVLMVQGSDGTDEFIDNCRKSCRKKCTDVCRNANRRINIYKNYVNKNFSSLDIDYQFFGGVKTSPKEIYIEEYIVNKNYDSVFLIKRN